MGKANKGDSLQANNPISLSGTIKLKPGAAIVQGILVGLGLILALSFCSLMAACSTKDSSLASAPRDIRAHMDLAGSYLAAEEPRKSLRELLPLRDRAGKYPEYHFLLGATYSMLDDCRQAVQHLQTAVQQKPDFGAGWNNLGQAQVACNQYQQAEQSFKQALELSTYLTPEFPAYNLSRLYWEQDKVEQAVHYAEQAVELNWRYLPAYNQLADIHLENQQREKAVHWLRKAVEAAPDNDHFLFRLAENELRLGNTKQAAYWLQRILEVKPDSSNAQMARDYLDIIKE